MSVPQSCTVLVIGGGPGGSYTASVLAREGVDTVVLEADKFPRYHIGESMLPSMRYFLRFIDLETKFDNHGFTKKLGAAFKLNHDKLEGYTDFLAANGPNSHAWNVIRSESDELMFKHAGDCGALVFDGTKVESIAFDTADDAEAGELGRPVSATWSRKDGTTGQIKFDYLVDASGRVGMVSTKYLKNRTFNQGLKNIANWGYWKGVKPYAPGTEREGQPFFEALNDGSGWVWAIPLHDGNTSMGVVMRQDLATAKKKAMDSPSGADFYSACITMAPIMSQLTSGASLVSGVKSASDWSYSASSYASPHLRIVGDAGCFIDPFFSSGVHLAMTAALSAAMSIQAARKGDCDEQMAAKWHTSKVSDGYTRFLLVVLTALKQIRGQSANILNEERDEGFDNAFNLFRPIIQGGADTTFHRKQTEDEVSATVDFCLDAFQKLSPEDDADDLPASKSGAWGAVPRNASLEKLTDEERQILKTMQTKRMLEEGEDMIMNIDDFSAGTLNGFAPRLKRGNLGLMHVAIAQGKNGVVA